MNRATKVWVDVTLGVLLFAAIGWMIKELPCPTSTQYIYMRFGLALALALLSVLLTGGIRLKYFAVRATSGFAILLLAAWFTPEVIDTSDKCTTPLRLEIYLRDTGDKSIDGLAGTVSVLINNSFYQEAQVDGRGRVTFENIPTNFTMSGSNQMKVELKNMYGYSFQTNQQKVLDTVSTAGNMTLRLSPDGSECCVKGYVRDERSDRGLDSVTVLLTNTNSSTTTDKNGHYEIMVPHAIRKETLVVQVTKPSYVPRTREVTTGGDQNDIYLTPGK